MPEQEQKFTGGQCDGVLYRVYWTLNSNIDVFGTRHFESGGGIFLGQLVMHVRWTGLHPTLIRKAKAMALMWKSIVEVGLILMGRMTMKVVITGTIVHLGSQGGIKIHLLRLETLA